MFGGAASGIIKRGNVIIGIIGYRWLSNLSSVPCLSGVVSQVCWSVRVVLHLVYAPSSRC